MAQFDVLRVKGNVLVLDCQSNFLAALPTGFVVPLRPETKVRPGKLTPLLDLGSNQFVMVTPLARAISTRDIVATIVSVGDQEYVIKAALDMLITGF